MPAFAFSSLVLEAAGQHRLYRGDLKFEANNDFFFANID